MKKLRRESRYDSIIIWGHGLSHIEEILMMIRNIKTFDIVRVVKYQPSNMKKFIRKVYSYDYAPLAHLKSKIKYLERVEPSLICIVIKNHFPDIDILGEGSFRHKESLTLKKLKTEIRKRFNPYKDGEMTHDHIIHATDNEEQTHHILNAIGDISIKDYYQSNLYSIPFFLGKQVKYKIMEVESGNLVCGQAQGESEKFQIIRVPVKESVQYRALFGEEKAYQEYVTKYLGTALKSDYHVDKFLSLAKDFRYLSPGHENSYVVVKELAEKGYLIADGLHRASLHLSQGNTKIKVCVIK